MASLREMKELRDAWSAFKTATTFDPKQQQPAPVLFSSQEDQDYDLRASHVTKHISSFITAAKKANRPNELANFQKMATYAHNELNVIFDQKLFHTEAKNLSYKAILRDLEYAISNNAAIKAKLKEFDKMYQDFFAKPQFANPQEAPLADPSVTHGIIEQLIQQMRYDPLGNIIAYLMRTSINISLEAAGLPILPEPKQSDRQDQGAIAEMLARNQPKIVT